MGAVAAPPASRWRSEELEQTLAYLYPVRDRVLDHAHLREGETVLDVGSGDGLIAFGALERVGPSGTVIFSDISQDLLDHAHTLAEQMGVLDRCRFLRATADDLAAIADSSVDVVTARSVLIYVTDKPRAFAEFFCVLRSGGRISLFEPINRFLRRRTCIMGCGSDPGVARPDTRRL